MLRQAGKTGWEQELSDNLVMRPVRDEHDAERFVGLSEVVNHQGADCERLIHHHPACARDHFIIVEDTRTGEVVSTTCIIPWRARMGGIDLNVAQLEMAVTHPDYRHRGLIRAQINRYHRLLAEQQYDLSLIEGIPYYYRRFGYAYALDHRCDASLPVTCIPDEWEAELLRLRPAQPEDAALLTHLFERETERLDLHVLRTAEYWRYILAHMELGVWVVEAGESRSEAVGYLVTDPLVAADGSRRGTCVDESSVADQADALAVLRWLKRQGGSEIRVTWPRMGDLAAVARDLGSQPISRYQWLVRIVDIRRFLRKIGPVLERRLALSDLAGYSADLVLNLYEEAFRLRFSGGRLLAVEPAGFIDYSMGADGGDLCIPVEAFVRLLVGYRDLDQLFDAWPDIVVKEDARQALEVLFPKLASDLQILY